MCSLETSISTHPIHCEKGEFGVGLSSMGQNPKPLVEIPHRHSIDNRGSSEGIEQFKKAINDATFGRIGLVSSGEEVNRFKELGLIPPGELSNNEIVSTSQSSEEVQSTGVLQGGHTGDSEVYVIWTLEWVGSKDLRRRLG